MKNDKKPKQKVTADMPREKVNKSNRALHARLREEAGNPIQPKQQKMRCIALMQETLQEKDGEIADLKSPTLQNQKIAELEEEIENLRDDRKFLMEQRVNILQECAIANAEALHLKNLVSKLLENDPESKPLNEVREEVEKFMKHVPIDEVPKWVHLFVHDPNEMIPRSEVKRKVPLNKSSEPPPNKKQTKLEKALATLKTSTSSSRSTSQGSRTSTGTPGSSSNAVWNPAAQRPVDPNTHQFVPSPGNFS